MRSSRRGWPLIAALVVPLLLSAGCTGSDVLETGNTGVVVRVALSNPDTRFDVASQASITQLNVRPADPDAAATLGTRPIAVLATTADVINIDFRNDALDDPSRVLLSTGLYNISTIQFTNIVLRQSALPATWTACSQAPATVRPGSNPPTLLNGWVLSTLSFNTGDLGSQATFRVEGGDGDQVVIEIVADAFIEAFTNSWNCVNTPNGPAPNTFNAALFKSLASTYLRISG